MVSLIPCSVTGIRKGRRQFKAVSVRHCLPHHQVFLHHVFLYRTLFQHGLPCRLFLHNILPDHLQLYPMTVSLLKRLWVDNPGRHGHFRHTCRHRPCQELVHFSNHLVEFLAQFCSWSCALSRWYLMASSFSRGLSHVSWHLFMIFLIFAHLFAPWLFFSFSPSSSS